MAGNKIGGQKARDKNLAKNPNFYRDIGKIGGRNGHSGGFAVNKGLASSAGRRAGHISKRGHKFIKETPKFRYYLKKSTGEVVRYRRFDVQEEF